ncbi:MAG: sigma-54 dependent transcriptional regulator [Bacteroidales bacterium]
MKDLLTFIAIEDKALTTRIQDILKQFEDVNFISYKNGKSCTDDFHKKPHLVIFSIALPDIAGSVLLKKIKKYDPDITMVFITPESKSDQIPQLLNLGAYSYINRDKDSDDRIWDVLNNALNEVQQSSELRRLRFEIGKKYKYTSILRGKSQWMQELYSAIDKAARSSIPVSLFGEPGTGKKLIAKTIHYHSAYANNPFVEVNVGAIPENLIEAELFGSEKVPIHGERDIRQGKFEEAQRGTLYIRSVEKLSPMMQQKLAGVLRDKYFCRLGSDNPLKFNCRVIIATEENLLDYVNKGKFDEDLYYKLLGLPIRVIPLRDRESDVVYMSRYFLNQFCRENEMEKISISSAAQEKLINYPYPGNIRELKAIVELAAVMANGEIIEPEHINFFSTNPMANLLLKENTLYEYTRQIIRNFMQKYDDDIMIVAKKLDVGKSTIYRMRKNGEI